MSTVRALLILACVATIAGVVWMQRRSVETGPKGAGEGRTNDGPAAREIEPDDASGDAAGEGRDPRQAGPGEFGSPGGPDGRRSSDDRPSDPGPDALVALDPELRVRLRAESEGWSFTEAELPALDRLDSEDAAIVARWRLRRALWQRARELEPPPPPVVQEVRLENGNRLWARSARRAGEDWTLELLSGVRTRLPGDRVEEVRELTDRRYLLETAPEARRTIEELEAGSPAERTQAIAIALRHDLEEEQLESIYRGWEETGGPRHLQERLAGNERDVLGAALAVLTPSGAISPAPPPAGDASPGDTTAREQPPAAPAPATVELPGDLADLSDRLTRMRRRLPRLRNPEDRSTLIETLLAWEVWLRDQPPDPAARERIDELSRQLQMLRLDILKGSGF